MIEAQTVLLLLSIVTSATGLGALLLRTGRQFGALESKMDGWIDGLRQEMVPRFEVVDRRFDGVDRRFDGVDQRFDGIAQRFDGVAQRFDGVDARLDRMDDRFDRVDDRLARVEDGLTGLRVDFARIGQRLDDHVLDPHAHRATATG